MSLEKNGIFKRRIIFVLMISFALGQYTPVQAAAKETNDSIVLNKTVYTVKKGKTVKLKATLNKSARKKGVEWKSSNPKIASVSKTGKITAKKKGKTTITARIKGTNVMARSRITVGTPVSKIFMERDEREDCKQHYRTDRSRFFPHRTGNAVQR